MTNTMTYQQAVNLPGLEPVRQAALKEHIACRNRALADRDPISPAVSRCAAALLAADVTQRLSSPTALAQAEALALRPGLGQTLARLQADLLELESLGPSELAQPGMQQDAMHIVLEQLLRDASRLLSYLGSHP